MKVCMLVWSYFPFPGGGAESQCRKICNSLSQDSNIDCVVLTAKLSARSQSQEMEGKVAIVRIPVPQSLIEKVIVWRDLCFQKSKNRGGSSDSSGSERDLVNKVTILSLLVRWSNALFFMLGASLWLVRHHRQIDILHVHIADWLAGYGGWLGKHLKIPVLCKASNMPPFPDISASIPFGKFWDRERRKVNFVALHDAIKDALVSGGVDAQSIFIIPNGVSIPMEVAHPETTGDVLYVGNFSQGANHKGFDVLFRAWAEVCKQNTTATLVMAGGGDSTPWREMCNDLHCADRVVFLGYVKDINTLYRHSAIVALPSRHEGMSNALLEAQAWGVPAVVSAIPGNMAIVDDGVSGFVVPIGDQSELASKILCLLEKPEMRKAMGGNARDKIQASYCINRVSAAYKKLYLTLARKF